MTPIEEAIQLVKKYDKREISIKILLHNLELLLKKENK